MISTHEMEELIRELWPQTGPFKDEPMESEGERVARLAYEAQKKRKQYETEEKKYLEVLKTMAHGESAEFGPYQFIKNSRTGSINYKAIPALLDIDLEQYRGVDVTVWQLSKKD